MTDLNKKIWQVCDENDLDNVLFEGSETKARKYQKQHGGSLCSSFPDPAEEWWKEQGKTVPVYGTPEYIAMYDAWCLS